MTDDEWDAWEEWMEMPLTRKFLTALARQSSIHRTAWVEGLWANPQHPHEGEFPDLRARSQVYRDLSEMDRETMTTLMGDINEHERNRSD